VSVSDDTTLIVWQYKDSIAEEEEGKKSWQSACTLTGYHTRPVYSVDWSSTNYIASAGGDDGICIFEETSRSISDGTCVWQRVFNAEKAHLSDVNCVKWNPDQEHYSNILLSAGDDGFVKIWKWVP